MSSSCGLWLIIISSRPLWVWNLETTKKSYVRRQSSWLTQGRWFLLCTLWVFPPPVELEKSPHTYMTLNVGTTLNPSEKKRRNSGKKLIMRKQHSRKGEHSCYNQFTIFDRVHSLRWFTLTWSMQNLASHWPTPHVFTPMIVQCCVLSWLLSQTLTCLHYIKVCVCTV